MMTPEALEQSAVPVPAIVFTVPVNMTADQLLATCRLHTSARRFTRDVQGLCIGIWMVEQPGHSLDADFNMAPPAGYWQVFAALGTDGRWHQTRFFELGSPVVKDWIPEELC